MKKYYHIAIATVLLSLIFTVTDTWAVKAAEENTEEMEAIGEVLAEGENLDDAMLADPLAETEGVGDMTQGQVFPAVATPDGMMVASAFPDDLLPLLFHKTTTSYQGTSVEAAQFDNGYVLLLYVTDGAGANGTFKQYNETTGELTDFRMIAGPGENYIIILPLPTDFAAPEGFEEVVLDWNGQSLSAYVNTTAETAIGSDTSASDYLLIYAISSNGRQGLYLYDQVESTYQRYLDIAGTSSSSSSGEGVLDLNGVKEGNSDAVVRLIIICAMALLIIVLIILVIVLSVRLREYSGYDYIDEEEYNAINRASLQSQEQHALKNRHTSRGVNVMQYEEDGPEDEPENEPDDNSDEDSREDVNGVDEAREAARYREERERAEQHQQQNAVRGQEQNSDRLRQEQSASRQQQSPARQQQNAVRSQQSASRRSLLETGDIADLDDILNDPNLTSNLPMISEIQREINRQSRAERARGGKGANAANKQTDVRPHSYEEMQVTVDSLDAGMPAMVDTDMIAEDMEPLAGNGNVETASKKSVAASEEKPSKESAGYNGNGVYPERDVDDGYSRDDSYSQDGYAQAGYDDPYGDDDYYLTRAERKERKALEKQRRREAKDAEREAKYLEKERRRAEKHKKYGYDEATPMDWSEFGNAMREEPTNADKRRPVGYDEEKLPAYMRGGSSKPEDRASADYDVQDRGSKAQTEEERANAAADAVIAAARGNDSLRDEEVEQEALRREKEYREYRKGARNQYEEFRRRDEEAAERERLRQIEEQGRVKSSHQADRPVNSEKSAETEPRNAQPARGEMQGQQPVTEVPTFSEDFDEDFEFEFLNIRRPQ